MLDAFTEVLVKKASDKKLEDQLTKEMMSLPMEELQKIASLGLIDAEGKDDSWLSKYEDTPLYDKAIALEEAHLSIEEKRLERRSQERKEQEREDFWEQEDMLRLKKRLLDLELSKLRAGIFDEKEEGEESEEEDEEISEKEAHARFLRKLASTPTFFEPPRVKKASRQKTTVKVAAQASLVSSESLASFDLAGRAMAHAMHKTSADLASDLTHGLLTTGGGILGGATGYMAGDMLPSGHSVLGNKSVRDIASGLGAIGGTIGGTALGGAASGALQTQDAGGALAGAKGALSGGARSAATHAAALGGLGGTIGAVGGYTPRGRLSGAASGAIRGAGLGGFFGGLSGGQQGSSEAIEAYKQQQAQQEKSASFNPHMNALLAGGGSAAGAVAGAKGGSMIPLSNPLARYMATAGGGALGALAGGALGGAASGAIQTGSLGGTLAGARGALSGGSQGALQGGALGAGIGGLTGATVDPFNHPSRSIVEAGFAGANVGSTLGGVVGSARGSANNVMQYQSQQRRDARQRAQQEKAAEDLQASPRTLHQIMPEYGQVSRDYSAAAKPVRTGAAIGAGVGGLGGAVLGGVLGRRAGLTPEGAIVGGGLGVPLGGVAGAVIGRNFADTNKLDALGEKSKALEDEIDAREKHLESQLIGPYGGDFSRQALHDSLNQGYKMVGMSPEHDAAFNEMALRYSSTKAAAASMAKHALSMQQFGKGIRGAAVGALKDGAFGGATGAAGGAAGGALFGGVGAAPGAAIGGAGGLIGGGITGAIKGWQNSAK